MGKVLRQNTDILRQGDEVLIQKLIGNGLKLDGVNDRGYRASGFTYDPAKSYTFDMYIRLRNSGNGLFTPISFGGGTPKCTIERGSRKVLFHINGLGGYVVAGRSVEFDKLFRLTGIFDRSGSDFCDTYFDGEFDRRVNQPDPGISTQDINLGVDVNGGSNFMNGDMYFMAVYESVVVPNGADIVGDFEANKADALMAFNFARKRGTSLMDITGNGKHLSLNGFSTTTNYGGGAWLNSEGGVAK